MVEQAIFFFVFSTQAPPAPNNQQKLKLVLQSRGKAP